MATKDIPAPVRFPDIEVELVGSDSNAFAVLGKVQGALKRGLRDAGHDATEVKALCDEFMTEATSGDYDHLIQTCMAWVEVV